MLPFPWPVCSLARPSCYANIYGCAFWFGSSQSFTWDESFHWATLHAIRRILNEINLTFWYLLYHRYESVHIVRVRVAKSGFLAPISQIKKNLKNLMFKSDLSHKQDAFFHNHIFPLKSSQTLAVVLFPWPGSLHFALTCTGAHSDLGHQSFTCDRKPFLGNIAFAIRHFLKQN